MKFVRPYRRQVSVAQEDKLAMRVGLFIIRDDATGKVVGTLNAAYHPEIQTVFVDGMDVTETHRRKGYGRRLYEKFELYIRDRGYATVMLNSFEDSRPFWKAMGFVGVDIPLGGLYLMEKDL